MSNDPFQTVGFGENDESIKTNKLRSLKFTKNEVRRLSIASWPEKEDGTFDMDVTPKMLSAKVHWIDGAGYVVNQGPEYTKLAGEEPKDRVGIVVVSWPVHEDGSLDKDLLALKRWTVEPWILSASKYLDLKRMHVKKHLGMHDLQVTCDNPQYQNLKMSDYDNCLLRSIMEKKPDHFEEIKMKVDKHQANLKKLIGRVLSIDKLREKMGEDAAVSSSDPITASSADSEEFDSMLDDITG